MATVTKNPASAVRVACVPLRRHLLPIVLAAIAALLSGCGGPTSGPEESLRQWVAQGQTAANEEDRSTMIDLISPAYADARGNSRDDIETLLRVYFFRMNDVGVIVKIDELTIIDQTAAELILIVGMAATHDGTLGFSADAYRFEMELERDDEQWLLIGAEWGELGGELH